jgi:endoglycosylceramidase
MMLAAARRETFSAAPTLSAAAAAVAVSAPSTSTTNGSSGAVDPASAITRSPTIAAAAPQTTLPTDLTALFNQVVYTPIHTVVENWIDSDLGQAVDGVINALAGSYVIGDGVAGTAAHPIGGDCRNNGGSGLGLTRRA